MNILGIETSCDETAAALVACAEGPRFSVVKNAVASQAATHAPYGGVVPNIAKREHEKKLPGVVEEALSSVGHRPSALDAIAVTSGPGLEPALWQGITYAQELAKKWQKPLIPVNHMIGHLISPFLQKNLEENIFPAIGLLVSGGHTELILAKAWNAMSILGKTRDDAVGEAFDKVARLLGLPYPGGPALSALASRYTPSAIRYSLPRPMLHSKNYDFSFSGLKTAVLYLLREIGTPTEEQKIAIAHEFQEAAVEVLVSKTTSAIQEYRVKTLLVGGGVVANARLRESLSLKLSGTNTMILFPPGEYAGDNGAMIAAAGYLRWLDRDAHPLPDPDTIKAEGNLKI